MKKLVLIILAAAVALSLAGCGKDKTYIPKETPTLTVSYGGKTITADMYTNQWSYVWGGSWTGYVADSIDPADDDDIVVLNVSESDLEENDTAVLRFDYPPQRVNGAEVTGEEITIRLHGGLNTIHAEWDIPDRVKGDSDYAFYCNAG